jgi:lysophospholipase L1-like esterase
MVLQLLAMKIHPVLRTLLISKSSRLKYVQDLSPIKSGIAILGDSIVQGGNWSLLLGTEVRNLGVSDFTTYDLLRHLNKLVRGAPDIVIIAVGVNDLIRKAEQLDRSYANIRSIINGIKSIRQNATIFVISVLPMDQATYPNINEAIERFNMILATMCSETAVTYINAHDSFVENGILGCEYSVDGLHLTDVGYAAYAFVLKRFI